MKKIGFLFILTTFFLNISWAAMSSRGVNTMKQPFTSVNIDITGCTYQVLINDVPIMENADGLPVQVTIPVNEWMRSGKNTFSMRLGPVEDANKLAEDGQSCKATAELLLRESSAPKSDNIVISKLSYHSPANHFPQRLVEMDGSTLPGNYELAEAKLISDEKGQINHGEIFIKKSKESLGTGVTVAREITLPLNLPEWAWFKGEKIQNNEQTKEALGNIYKEIYSDIHAKNEKALAKLFLFRTKELRKAYYQPKDNQTTSEQIMQDANNKELELINLHPDYLTLKIFGDAKLAKLYYEYNGFDALVFNYKDTNQSSSYEITFAKLNGQWTIVR
jgi:hypothetical protein